MTALDSRRARVALAAVLALAVVGVGYVAVQLAGVLATILYGFLFLVGLAGVPTTILLFGPSLPKGLAGVLGKFHFILGQLAYGTGYLVQREDRWELCPGERDRVYIDEEWHDIVDGQTNLKILGWQPFGLLRFKDDDTLRRLRVDPASDLDTVTGSTTSTDGGARKRAGYREENPEVSISGLDGTWLVDLKRLYARGVKHIGGIDVIEATEQIMMRKTAREGRVTGYEPYIASLIGIVLGVATAYVMLGG